MNDQEDTLKSRVGGLVVPPADSFRKAETLHLALSALDAPASVIGFEITGHLVWKWAAACLMVAGIATFMTWPEHQMTLSHPYVAGNNEPSLKTLEEISLLFPDQLDAIISKGSQMDLQLSKTQVRENSDQVVKITCTNNKESCIIITYSGRDVSFKFADGDLRVTPLIDADGAVIILTQDRVISPDDTSQDSIQLTAATLVSQ
jgi:hypothetical protein